MLYWGKELDGKIDKTGCKLGYKSFIIPTSTTWYIFIVSIGNSDDMFFPSLSFCVYLYFFPKNHHFILCKQVAPSTLVKHLTAAHRILPFCSVQLLGQKDLARAHTTLPIVLGASEKKFVIASLMSTSIPSNRPTVLLCRCVAGRSKKADFNNCIHWDQV
jgi:hypothetical protein